MPPPGRPSFLSPGVLWLAETEAKLPGGFFTDHLEYMYPAKFSELAENNNRCLLTVKRESEPGLPVERYKKILKVIK